MKILDDNSMENIVGGQISIENVMGVEGLSMCTGAPTENNHEGVFWKRNGISLTKDAAMKLLAKKSKRSLNEEYTNEAFLANYINLYNAQIDGGIL